MDKKPKVIVLCGPTASGKTRLSIELAKKIKGEIISCDSMQIYKDMNIGTAKPTIEEMQGIKHHLLDFVFPNQRYDVADFQKQALETIKNILNNAKIPILVGGTGLYINSLTQNIQYPVIETDLSYRKQLEKQVEQEGLESLYKRATQIDEKAMETISKNDKKRILRVLEIYNQTGKTKTELEKQSQLIPSPYNYIKFAINIEREILYNRINERVDKMIEQGLVQEVKQLLEKYNDFPTAMQGIGYKEVVKYVRGEFSEEEMIEKIKMETRRYAKRQITWFRKDKDIIWLNGLAPTKENIQCILEGHGEK